MPDRQHFESYAERLIREAQERGEFDDLPGAGKPLADLDASYDPAWWARRLLARERVEDIRREARAARRTTNPKARAARLAELQRRLDAANAQLPPEERGRLEDE